MHWHLLDMLDSNPFRILRTSPTTPTSEILRRINALETRARHIGDGATCRLLANARQQLSNSDRRLLAEFLSPWDDDPVYSAVAEFHDKALALTIAMLGGDSPIDTEDPREFIWHWKWVAEDYDTGRLIDGRREDLGSKDGVFLWGLPFMAKVVSQTILPALVDQAIAHQAIPTEDLIFALLASEDFEYGIDANDSMDRIRMHCIRELMRLSDPNIRPEVAVDLLEKSCQTVEWFNRYPYQHEWEELSWVLILMAEAAIANLANRRHYWPVRGLIDLISSATLHEDALRHHDDVSLSTMQLLNLNTAANQISSL